MRTIFNIIRIRDALFLPHFLTLLSTVFTLLAPPARVERELYVMGTRMRGTVDADTRDGAETALDRAVSEVERFEGLLSTWDPATPMSALNRAPVDDEVTVAPELLRHLVEVESWARRTGRAFEPTVGPLVDAWGLRTAGRRPTRDEVALARARIGADAFGFHPERGTATRHLGGAWGDTGAWGKGAALRAAARSLRVPGVHRALLDLGGQMLALADSTAEAWTVAVAHPLERDEAVAWLRVANVSVATSGNSERGITVGGVVVGHILDPRTGRPVPDWGSVTVVSADPLVADVLSTALYVMGPEAGPAWADHLPDVGVLFLVLTDEGLRPVANQAMSRWLVSPDPSSLERRFP